MWTKSKRRKQTRGIGKYGKGRKKVREKIKKMD